MKNLVNLEKQKGRGKDQSKYNSYLENSFYAIILYVFHSWSGKQKKIYI